MSRPTALVADDEPLLRSGLIRQLALAWPDLSVVAQARNGSEAVELFEKLTPDICFLDVHMPGMSGVEAAQHIGRRAHLVFVTAFQQYAVTAFEQGALDYLVKPVQSARLAETVDRLQERLRLAKPATQTEAALDALLARLGHATTRSGLRWIRERAEYSFAKPLQTLALPARHFWDADYFKQHAPGVLRIDDRPDAPNTHVVWDGDRGQAGWFVHGYESAWLPASLLHKDRQALLADALFESTRHSGVSLHFNKGLAGAPASELAAARDTAMNPDVLDAFALAIIARGGSPAFPGMPGAGPDLASARAHADEIGKAMDALLEAAPGAGSYVSESDYFITDWQAAFWGSNYSRLAMVKKKYDPEGLFFVHHGLGSDEWSADGFSPA